VEVARHVLLYDADCGFCKWSLAKVLAWDRRRRLRPVALQDPEADSLLDGMDERRKMDSWHLVTPDRSVHSAGGAFAPLARLLPGGRPLAALAEAVPGITERLYRWVARNRSDFGRLVSRRSSKRAERRISAHGPRPDGV
jgi:predicted DCC family thiol-disulfide oxidoreductase YuxK